VGKKEVIISNGKIGGSPVYYILGQEYKLQMLEKHLGGREKEDYDAKGKLFDLDISIKYFSEDQFKIKKSSLCREIAKGHVLLFGAERFIALLWEGYYGLD